MLLLYADFILHGKDNANRRQYKTSLLVFIVEVPLILFKDNANRRQYKTSLLVFIVEVPLILFKDNANRRQYKASLLVFIVEVSLVLLKDSIVLLKKLIIFRFLLNFFLKWSYK